MERISVTLNDSTGTSPQRWTRPLRGWALTAFAGTAIAVPSVAFSQSPYAANNTAPWVVHAPGNNGAQSGQPYSQYPGSTITPAAGQMAPPQSEVQRQLELLYQQNGRQAPNMSNPGFQQPNYQQPRYQQPNFQQPVFQQPAGPEPLLQYSAHPSGSARQSAQSGSKRGFLDRVFSPFRKERLPSGPPMDPGMNYPKGPAAPAYTNNYLQPGNPTQRPVPPAAIAVAPTPIPQAPPALLQTPAVVGSISDPLHGGVLPPGPDGETTVPIMAPPRQKPATVALSLPETASAPDSVPGVLPPAPGPTASTQETLVIQSTPPVTETDNARDLGGFEFDDLAPASEAPVVANRSAGVTSLDETAQNRSEPGAQNSGNAAESAAALADGTGDQDVITNPYQGKTLEQELFSQSANLNSEPMVQEESTAVESTNSADVPELPPAPSEFVPFAAGESTGDQEPLRAQELSPPAPPLTTTVPVEPQGVATPAPHAEETAPEAETLDSSQPRLLPAPNAAEPPRLTAVPETSLSEIKPLPQSSHSKPSTQSKLERIAQREGSGLKGFCPVALRDDRDLIDSQPQFSANYRGQTFYFSSEKALQTFLNGPRQYAPAAGGHEVIHYALTGERLPGALDNAVWYKGRLYLFASVETMETFQSAPSSHATMD